MRPVSVLLLALATSGCYTTKVQLAPHGSGVNLVPHQERSVMLAWGLLTLSDVNLAGQCPAGVHSVRTEFGPLGVALSVLSFGLIGTMTTTYFCMKTD